MLIKNIYKSKRQIEREVLIMETIEKGFKYRIYPKNNQIEQIEVMFKAKRYVWNYFLKIKNYLIFY